MPKPKRYLSGIQSSGKPHIGNYLGAMRVHVDNPDNAFYFIANYHSLTTSRDAAQLRQATFDVAADYLAVGLDPTRATLFRQSDIPEVTELAWFLGCVTGMGLLERAVTYKDKLAKGLKPNVGLFTYPVLQAADILAFDSDVVPVGPDQVQHIEMTRDMAQYFNTAFGETFKLPDFVLGTPENVPGIDGHKMSKSYGNDIPIFARGKALKKQVMSIVTDSKSLEDKKDPDQCVVYSLYSLFATEDEKAEMAANYRGGNYGYGHAKLALLDKINETFEPFRERREYLENHPDDVEDVLRDAAKKARAVARSICDRARLACGLD